MQSLKDKDRQYIWHPFTSFTATPDPILIVEGKGVYLTDDSGKSYIDAISSWWVNLHGHGHPYIAERIYRQALQLEQVIFAGFTHQPAIALAERLLPLLPGSFARIFYSDNGSTATEVAVKMALQYWWNQSESTEIRKRTKIITFRDAYHGDTFGAMSVSDRSVFTLAFQDKLFEVVCIDAGTDRFTYSLSETFGYFFSCYACSYEDTSGGFKSMRDILLQYDNARLAVVPYDKKEEQQNLANLEILHEHGFEEVEGTMDNGWRKEFALNFAVWHLNHGKNWDDTKKLFDRYYTFKDAPGIWKEFYATLRDASKENTF